MALPYDVGKKDGIKEVALNLLKQGLPIETIATVTGLAPAIIQTLQD
jgi:hypothetical protein